MTIAEEMLSAATERAAGLAVPGLSPRPGRGVAVLTCMDTRIDPLAMLGLDHGDAHIVRNAGGLATDDAVRSLSVSQRVLGTREIVVVMHDDCGLCGASEDEYFAQLERDGARPNWRLGAFTNVENVLRTSLADLRARPELLSRDRIRGFVWDPEDGLLRDVEKRVTS